MINHAEIIEEQNHEIEQLRTDLSITTLALQDVRDTCKSQNLTADGKVAECLAESVHSLSLLKTKLGICNA